MFPVIMDYYDMTVVAHTSVTPATVASHRATPLLSGKPEEPLDEVNQLVGLSALTEIPQAQPLRPLLSSATRGNEQPEQTSPGAATVEVTTSIATTPRSTRPSTITTSHTSEKTDFPSEPEIMSAFLQHNASDLITIVAPTIAQQSPTVGLDSSSASTTNSSLPHFIPQNHADAIAGGTVGGILSSGLVIMGILAICGYGRTGPLGACFPAWLNPRRWSCPELRSLCCCGGNNSGYGRTPAGEPGEKDPDVEKGGNGDEIGESTHSTHTCLLKRATCTYKHSSNSSSHFGSLSPTSTIDGQRLHPEVKNASRIAQPATATSYRDRRSVA